MPRLTARHKRQIRISQPNLDSPGDIMNYSTNPLWQVREMEEGRVYLVLYFSNETQYGMTGRTRHRLPGIFTAFKPQEKTKTSVRNERACLEVVILCTSLV